MKKMGNVLIAMMLLFMFAPIAYMVAFSFNAGANTYEWYGFSLEHYATLLSNTEAQQAVVNSLEVMMTSGVLSLIAGTIVGISIASRQRFAGIQASTMAMWMTMPEVVVGFGLLMSLQQAGIELGFWTIVFGQVVLITPFVSMMMASRYHELSHEVLQAGYDLGATPLRVFLRIILPQLRPAMVSSFALSCALSMDDFVVNSFMASPDITTLPNYVYGAIRVAVTPEINALATLIVIVVLSVTGLFAWRKK